jgi:single-strand DNA-binding protein
VNKVIIIGRWTKDPELKFTAGKGTAVATGTIAVDRRIKREGQPSADFIPIVIWGKQAENTATYTGKGKLIAVSGRIQTRSYEANDGTRKYVTEIVADEVKFLEYLNSNSNTKGALQNKSNFDLATYDEDISSAEMDAEDIPF